MPTMARGDTASDDRAEVRSPAPAPSSPVEQTDQSGEHNVKSTSQPELSKENMSSSVKRDARAAELPDEEEQRGKFQQVEGLTAVDAEIPCEFSVEDAFMIDESAEDVDEEIVKAIVAGKKKELDTMEACGIFDVCEELPNNAKIITTRWENVPNLRKHSSNRLTGGHARGPTRIFNPVPRCGERVLPC